MLSPARKLLWRARREQRKLKLKLAPIVEEDEVFIEEKIWITEELENREEKMKSCEKYKDNLLGSNQVSSDNQLSCKARNSGGRSEKEKRSHLGGTF